MVVSFCAVIFRGVLDEILNLIESVSESFPSYSSIVFNLLSISIIVATWQFYFQWLFVFVFLFVTYNNTRVKLTKPHPRLPRLP